ncbi:MAG: glycosyltransferase [Rhizobiales bacterium]|nr:glycosyltransferase [Hyphomicrobiales bacterium]
MLDSLLNTVAVSLSALLSVPTAVYAAECAAAAFPRKGERRAPEARPAVAVVVPAHNEEDGISRTLSTIWPQLREDDRLVVVADNCDDRTALLAREAGAEVIERHDAARRGKGYALDAGIAGLANAPPPVVILVDADCRVGPDAVDLLARQALASGRPVQARYLMTAPADASLGQTVAAFAFLVKNRVRPLGLDALGLPCQLTGSGMAFPWELLRSAPLANAHLVEDMKLGLDLARAGHAPCFCDEALVTSRFPASEKGTRTQRQRWESGHLAMGRVALGALLETATYRNPAYLAMILDVIVPPLSLLCLLLGLALVAGAALAAGGASLASLILAAVNLFLLVAASMLAWSAFGRRVLPARALAAVPVYALGKIGLYPRLIPGRTRSGWIRTDRSGSDDR